MLLYNQRKEFVGIDEDDLKGLGFQNISELQNESHDFADLFVKKPGYIHNFKNFSWIDFILHSETDESKAIIHAKGRNFSCALHIAPFHFTSEESGFAVSIRSLRPLKGSEDLEASQDLEASGGVQATPAPISRQVEESPQLDISLEDLQIPDSADELEASFDSPPEPEVSLPSFDDSYAQELSEPEPLDIPDASEMYQDLGATENEFGAPLDIDFNESLTLDEDISIDDTPEPSYEEEPEFNIEEELAPVKEETPMLGDYVSPADDGEHLSDLVKSGTYVYEPQIAADELGLPVDLIEEFIGDFIDQAHEFHDDLYASIETADFDNVQILSHKLKGVAANLRVEDAFDVLSVVNHSKDPEQVLPNLNHFYKIIAKLEGKELPQESAAPAPTPEPAAEPDLSDIDMSVDIKQPEDGPMLIDEDVTPLSNNDDMYDDLLVSPDELSEPSYAQPQPEVNLVAENDDDDIYGDLLGGSDDFNASESVSHSEPETNSTEDHDDIYGDLLGGSDDFSAPEEFAEVPNTSIENDDLYDDMLSPENVVPVQESLSVEVAPLNLDENRTANELGIPVDIVKEFIQDFKEQVKTHRVDFDKAITSQNIKEVNNTATLLKGMSDNLRLTEISEVLKQLQQENNINNTAQALATLQAYADQL